MTRNGLDEKTSFPALCRSMNIGILKIAAFGALNQGSYDMFAQEMRRQAANQRRDVVIACAGPYPNPQATGTLDRPLRAEALQDEILRENLVKAVAADALALGSDFHVWCMPCLSMIGFHDEIEKTLGRPIIRLADALIDHYRTIDRIGIIHMRPAAQRIKEMFGNKAVTPDEQQATRLHEAEGKPQAVETIMKDITENWGAQGLTHVLFARADAPMAIIGQAGQIQGITINSYFDILTGHILHKFTY